MKLIDVGIGQTHKQPTIYGLQAPNTEYLKTQD